MMGIAENLPAFSRYGKALKKQAESMREGTQGMTEAQKRSRVSAEQEAAGKQIGAMQQDLSQQMMAAGPQWQGQYGTAIGELGAEAGRVGAKAAADVERESAAQAENLRKETMAALDAERTRATNLIVGGLGAGSKQLFGEGGPVEGFLDESAAQKVESGRGKMGAPALNLLKYAIPFFLCWMAREVVPDHWRDCRTYILFRAPRWFRNWYIVHGAEAADWLYAHPWAKIPLYPLFRYFAWQGKRMAKKNPALVEAQAFLP